MIGYIQGRFDVVHYGHILALDSARRYLGPSGQLIVGVATDAFCERWKGRPPLLGWHERATVIRALRPVALVIPYDGDPEPVHARLGFDVFFCSDELYDTYRDTFALRPWRTIYLPRTPGISSSELKEPAASHQRPEGSA